MIYRSILQCFADGFQWILLFYFSIVLLFEETRRVCLRVFFFIYYLVIVCELLLFAIRSSVLEKNCYFLYEFWCFFFNGLFAFYFLNSYYNSMRVCVFVYVYILYNMEHSVTLAGCSPMYFGFFLFRLARLILHYITSPK